MTDLEQQEARGQRDGLREAYEAWKRKGLRLDLSRGRPSAEQLALVEPMLTLLSTGEDCQTEGIDARNYGEGLGLPAARRYFGDLLGCRLEECLVGGNSSLALMYDLLSRACTHGLLHSEKPWSRQEGLQFLCPCPGYDRHFRITASLGMELIPISMGPEGPDMAQVEARVRDPRVKGIWCVPVYANPTGVVYSEETIHRLAALRPAAGDFALLWDNAYCVHSLEGPPPDMPDILTLCREAGNPDMVYEFASTSKITFPGAGISVLAASEANLRYLGGLLAVQTIGYDKLNQLRHVRFLRDRAHTLALMEDHARLLRPRFRLVLDTLERRLGGRGLASWTEPKGGYFIALTTREGLAARTLALCRKAGVVISTPGAAFPGGVDPHDSFIRIAPTGLSLEDTSVAAEVLCLSLRLAAEEQEGGTRAE